MELKRNLIDMAIRAKEASRCMGSLKTSVKNKALHEMAAELLRSRKDIIKANATDLKKAKMRKLKSSLIDRLALNDKRIKNMAGSIEIIAGLEDPVGSMERLTKRPNGLLIGKMRVPIGVIGIIYESRPNVTTDCVALCLKSGNCIILRGGTEAINSNIAIFDILNRVSLSNGVPQGTLNYIRNTDRKAVDILLGLQGLVDLIIPRGGESLIKEVTKKSKIAVIKHYKGVCHTYIDEESNLNMAESIAYNAKVQRPGVCNAMETLLVHRDIAMRFLPPLAKRLTEAGVELRGCPLTRKILVRRNVKKALESDWRAEYLDLILSIKVVGGLSEAIQHINKYGTSHSDAIVTENYVNAMKFLQEVDSSSVYVNASTRFTDGYEFGKGAEMGISTDKLHARGPMGLEELTTYKYVIFGDGQIRV